MIERYNIDFVISDNRFGLWNRKTKSIYITHQINIKFPKVLSVFEYPAYLIHNAIIQRYGLCWIPDEETESNLSGELSHKYPLPSNAVFIGVMSRFLLKINSQTNNPPYEIVAILSGPEPQRTILEEKILGQLQQLNKKSLVVSGKPGLKTTSIEWGRITKVSHLSTKDIKFHILHSDFVICRSGYSIIMDLVVLGKPALIIPTPGQTEQEYLGNYMNSRKLFICMKQGQLDIKKGLEKLKKLKSPAIMHNTTLLEKQLENLETVI